MEPARRVKPRNRKRSKNGVEDRGCSCPFLWRRMAKIMGMQANILQSGPCWPAEVASRRRCGLCTGKVFGRADQEMAELDLVL